MPTMKCREVARKLDEIDAALNNLKHALVDNYAHANARRAFHMAALDKLDIERLDDIRRTVDIIRQRYAP